MKQYVPIADAIAALAAPYVEVVIHDLASDTVAHVANPFSAREAGDPSLLEDADFPTDRDVIGPYEKTSFDGRKLRSISVVLRDGSEAPLGLLCINCDLSGLEKARLVLEHFLGATASTPQIEQFFQNDWQERINQFIQQWLADHQLSLAQLTRKQKRDLVFALAGEGAFEGKGAANYVARLLGMGRATVYKHLKAYSG